MTPLHINSINREYPSHILPLVNLQSLIMVIGVQCSAFMYKGQQLGNLISKLHYLNWIADLCGTSKGLPKLKIPLLYKKIY